MENMVTISEERYKQLLAIEEAYLGKRNDTPQIGGAPQPFIDTENYRFTESPKPWVWG
jgi:hypothetical protein